VCGQYKNIFANGGGIFFYENGQFLFKKLETLPNDVHDILWQWYLYNYTLPIPPVLKDGMYIYNFFQKYGLEGTQRRIIYL